MAEKQEEIKILVTERPDGPEDKSKLRTPSGEANIQVVTASWWSQVLIRGLRSYIQNVLGYLLGAGLGVGVAHAAEALAAVAGVDVPVEARTFLTLLLSAMGAAIGPTVVCLLQNAIEILARLDVTNPTLRA